MFRANIKAGTELGMKAQEYMNAGKLVPDEITVAMVADRLKQPDCQAGYLLDGYPRTLVQVQAFEKLSKEIAKPVEIVINLIVEFDALADRVTGRRNCKGCGAIYHIRNHPSKVEGICDICGSPLTQRADDTEEQLRVRLDEYEKIPDRYWIIIGNRVWWWTSMPHVQLMRCGTMLPPHWRM